MIVTTSILIEQLHDYSDPAGRIMRMKRDGQLYRLTRGVYETEIALLHCYSAKAIS